MYIDKIKAHIIDTFWFRPILIATVFVVLSELLVRTDIYLGTTTSQEIFGMGVDGARSMLTTLGTAVLTATAMAFSVTVSVMATTSSSYGARLVKNFMTDQRNQIVMGILSGTFLYALWVLRYIQTNEDGAIFVPSFAMIGAVVLGFVTILTLIYFIHHIADYTQISTLLRRSRDDLSSSIQAYLEQVRAFSDKSVRHPNAWNRRALYEVVARGEGYVQLIDLESLVETARKAGVRITLNVQPGDYVYAPTPIATLSKQADEETEGAVWGALTLGNARTVYQDMRFAFQQPLDILSRALSSGINDPYTAVNALDCIEGALYELAANKRALRHLSDKNGICRVEVEYATFEDIKRQVLATVQQYAGSEISVTDRMNDLKAALKQI